MSEEGDTDLSVKETYNDSDFDALSDKDVAKKITYDEDHDGSDEDYSDNDGGEDDNNDDEEFDDNGDGGGG